MTLTQGYELEPCFTLCKVASAGLKNQRIRPPQARSGGATFRSRRRFMVDLVLTPRPVARGRGVLPSTPNMQPHSSPREAISRPLSRLVMAATLVAFLVAQPWVVCAPLCLLNGHAQVAMAASQHPDHVIHCHSDTVIRSELPAAQSLGSMLPARWVPVLPSLRVVILDLGSPTLAHVHQVPPADPPPPRPV